jgi:hypothetical protein
MPVSSLATLTRANHQLYQFTEQYQLLQPQQWALALKIQQQTQGPLEVILWQLGFLDSQHLSLFWQRREQLS